MTKDAAQTEGFTVDRLGARLALMLVIALTPIGMLAMVQTANLSRQAEANALQAVSGATMRVAAPEISMIRAAQTMAKTLALAVVPKVDDPVACRALMDAVAKAEPAISLVAYVPMSGMMTCASGGRSYDFSDNPVFAKLIARPAPQVVLNRVAPVSATSILGVAHPVFDASGMQLGVVSLSLPHEALHAADLSPHDNPLQRNAVALITFDATGAILTSSTGLDDAPLRIPRDVALANLAKADQPGFIGTSVAGNRRVFSVVRITDGVFLLGTWQMTEDALALDEDVAPYVFPLLMLLAGLAVAILAAERLVTRHVRRLGRSMSSFAQGNRATSAPPLADAPMELRDLGAAYCNMTQTILQDEAEMENLLRQKQLLLREVHHRTGNSLQLIASILRMHLRENPSDEVRAVLDGLHDRVIGLATVHLGLYRTAGQGGLAMDALIADVVRQMRTMLQRSGQAVDIQTNLDPIEMTPEQAVPLALLLAEILSGFPKESDEAGQAPLTVGFHRLSENRAALQVTGPARQEPQAHGPQAISERLIRGFVQQLDGNLDLRKDADHSDVTLEFTLRELNTA